MSDNKSSAELLKDTLLVKKKHAADFDSAAVKKASEFSKGYVKFLNNAKTEREAAQQAVKMLKTAGYKEYAFGKKYATGDKIYYVNRKKAVIAATFGSETVDKGVRLTIAHIDSPRLDAKPNPLYENEEMAFFKTHYYGGIRKYQWVAIPLAMHGVVVKSNGEIAEICIGEETGDPVFCVTDLLPHLSQEQNKRSLAEGVKGEELNILIGSAPFEMDKEGSNRVKMEAMRLLNEKYDITEHDFVRAEIEFVPAFKASDLGLDRSMIGGYGQDDRVCAYPALIAEIEQQTPIKTTVCVLTDKEETGSDGNTGLCSTYLFDFLDNIAQVQGVSSRAMYAASVCLSADVSAAFDPTFPEPFERSNSAFLNYGVALNKYTGSRGKGGTSDASAETMGELTLLLDKENVQYQICELGKVDAGGGGTIAKYIANKNVDVVDIGVPVLSMHSPFEISSKMDIYSTYRAFCVFASQK